MKPLSKIKIRWSPNFAYAIGLLATDGSLSKYGRHIDFTSKDLEQLKNFKKCLRIKNKIGTKTSGYSKKKYHRIQFGDVRFYKFLLSIGLMPRKSKLLSSLKIPNKYFFDFLRGHFDGDGAFCSYWDKRWISSFMMYTVFYSASIPHIEWLRGRIFQFLKIKGHINAGCREWQLKYAKKDSIKLLQKMYYSNDNVYLSRKLLKIKKALSIIGLSL